MDLAQCNSKERDLDDSGCVQDESLLSKHLSQCEDQRICLLDLSDDVLLHILQYCEAYDLKALGYTCPRLGRLVLDRTLWRRVDAQAQPTGRARFKWFVERAFNKETREVLLRGYALENRGCRGHDDRPSADRTKGSPKFMSCAVPRDEAKDKSNGHPPYPVRQPAQLYIRACTSRQLPRYTGHPYWPNDEEILPHSAPTPANVGQCLGAQLTFSKATLAQLVANCPNLTTLELEYCVIDVRTTDLSHFPKSLKRLSLRGTKCYNITMDKALLFRINDYLPEVEWLDISECEWLYPAALLPLSKMGKLKELYARDCVNLKEFVAYGSLAAVRGFRVLQVLDLSGSPLGDSEASSFGWLPRLGSLALRPPLAPLAVHQHRHYRDEPFVECSGLADWELEEPPYYKSSQEEPEETPPETPPVSNANREGTQIFTITFDRENGPRVENFVVPHGMLNGALHQNGLLNGIDNRAEEHRQENGPRPETNQENADSSRPETAERKEENGELKPETIDKEERVPEHVADHRQEATPQPETREEQPSTSSQPSTSKRKLEDSDTTPNKRLKNMQTSVRFRRNQPPVVVMRDPDRPDVEILRDLPPDSDVSRLQSVDESAERPVICVNVRNQNEAQNNEENPVICVNLNQERQEQRPVFVVNLRRDDANPPEAAINPIDAPVSPDRQVIYVNPRADAEEAIRMPCYRHVLYAPPPRRLDPSSLITDLTIRGYGISDVRNYVHIGRNGVVFGMAGPHNRPTKSVLKRLVCTGYSGITDASLNHLMYAAPELEFIDFSNTNVTEAGVESFRAIRPNCEVVYSKFEKDD